MKLTEKVLMSMGGARTFLEAKRLCATSQISTVSYNPPLLKGKIGVHGKQFFSGLLIRNTTSVENLCSCKESRRYGVICAHSVAIGLSLLPSAPHTTSTQHGALVSDPKDGIQEKGPEEFPQVALFLDGSLRCMEADIQFHYSQLNYRNSVAENAVFSELIALGFERSHGHIILRGEDAVLNFYSAVLPRLRSKWKIAEGTRWTQVTTSFTFIEPQFAIRKHEGGWLDCCIHYAAGKEAIFSQADIQRLLTTGRSYIRLKSGRIAVANASQLTKIEEILSDCNPIQQAEKWHIPAVFAPYFQESIAACSSRTSLPSSLIELPLGSMKQRLRPYQIQGAQWLLARSKAGLGGLLADEMGLGKTVQILAMLESLGGPALVICPSSLIWNWEREAKRFLPNLRVMTIHGSKRTEAFSKISECDLSVTSYALLRRDISQYQSITFSAIILDEAQHIKNSESKNAKSVYILRGKSRFALTGTPVENSIRDLWALFHFILPGYLGSLQSFKDRYETPLLESSNGDVARQIASRISPYVLRRLKREVVKDLPEKIEQVVEVELSQAQKAAYLDLQVAVRRKLGELTTASPNAARIWTLTALLRLRQLCCDLRLIHPQVKEPSSKIEAFLALMQGIVTGNHRVLVFSQFTSMLDLIEITLNSEKIRYCRLDGSTRDHKNIVLQFQQDCSISVFLISLKVGGVGLNLTAADTVIHFDPWWNPAVEAQATARAHRIGQEQPVTSIKLIARGTVEERILHMQHTKQELLSGTFDLEKTLAQLPIGELLELIS